MLKSEMHLVGAIAIHRCSSGKPNSIAIVRKVKRYTFNEQVTGVGIDN